MGKSYTLLVTHLLFLILVTSADVKVRGNLENTGDTKNVETSKRSSSGKYKIEDTETKGKDQVHGGSKEKGGISTKDSDKNVAIKELEEKDGGDNKMKTADLGTDEVGDKKDKVGEGLDSASIKGTSPTVKKDILRGEECDSSSNSCTIKEKGLVACLRVPGNESPDLSLLIQNKAKETVTVSISAPSFVHLEKKQIQLLEKETNKVKVSIGKGGVDNTIILTAGSENCTLEFKDLITQGSSKDTGSYSWFAYTSFLKNASSFWFILLAVFMKIGCVLAFFGFRLKRGSKYEKLDMELPISSNLNREAGSNDGWDNSWDDNWDDEEAPKTPSLPVTPSLPSKGIASRRTNKEWKD